MALPLFCIADEAKPFIHKILAVNKQDEESCKTFFLVESQDFPKHNRAFKESLKANEDFETEFVGASEQECRNWAREHQKHGEFIEHNIVAIADSRTAKDSTISLPVYKEHDQCKFEGYGILPPTPNAWYDWRVNAQGAAKVLIHLRYGPMETGWPTYFARKAELTDEDGVFDVTKADRVVCDQDTEICIYSRND
ncbi:hypothetical protein BDV95DRAFT_618837 [Massariosphaeria phaeospora]|uniref:Uncharacterized protein n=1 Tax=Massariosphaeria phaeospora TaxID=100035 RepID=A0A7C8MEN1_9PLEO|nr:hypothetical protein BDV95DRAFT_618837 [Massariosphaeria phaeospora]